MQREQGTLGEIWEKERAGNGAGTKEGQKEKNSRFACKYTKNGIIKENQNVNPKVFVIFTKIQPVEKEGKIGHNVLRQRFNIKVTNLSFSIWACREMWSIF